MAKKSSGSKANFHGTYSCFPSPTENQGKNTNKGNPRSAMNNTDVKSGNEGQHRPLVGYGKDSRAMPEDLNEHPSLGQKSIKDVQKSKSSFGAANASYKRDV